MGRPEMTQDELQKLLNYDPYSGVFTWKQYRNQLALKGGIAGNIRPDGYIQIKVKGKLYLAHRLAWLYVTGKWPSMDIDHIDGGRRNNRFSNLREATRSENKHNTCWSSGVHWCNTHKIWIAQFQINKVRVVLGRSKNKSELEQLYLERKKEFILQNRSS